MLAAHAVGEWVLRAAPSGAARDAKPLERWRRTRSGARTPVTFGSPGGTLSPHQIDPASLRGTFRRTQGVSCSVTALIDGSSGSVPTSNPSSRATCNMVVFSASTLP